MTSRRHVTLRDVAREAGVSVRTVSNVVNDFHYVSGETREKVEAAIAVLGYRPNRSARSLRNGSTRTLGLVLPEFSQPYFAELADTVFAAAAEVGYKVLIETLGPGGDDRIADVVGDLAVSTDGVLVSPTFLDGTTLEAEDSPVPMVALTARRIDAGFDHVAMDDAKGAELATAHLLGMGRRRIAAIGSALGFARHGRTGEARHRGYLAAHATAGVEPDDALAVGTTEWTQASGYEAVRELRRRGAEFDAVFAMNDLLAIGVLHALQDEGVAIPDDVAVAGFDDIAMAGHLSPPLTTIDPGMREIVDTAIRLLLGRIDGSRTGEGEEFLAPPTLIVRASTHAPS